MINVWPFIKVLTFHHQDVPNPKTYMILCLFYTFTDYQKQTNQFGLIRNVRSFLKLNSLRFLTKLKCFHVLLVFESVLHYFTVYPQKHRKKTSIQNEEKNVKVVI